MIRLSAMGVYCGKEQGKDVSCCIHTNQNHIHSCLFICNCMNRANGPTATLEKMLLMKRSQPKVYKSTVSLMSSWVLSPPSPTLSFLWSTCSLPKLLSNSWLLVTAFISCLSTTLTDHPLCVSALQAAKRTEFDWLDLSPSWVQCLHWEELEKQSFGWTTTE